MIILLSLMLYILILVYIPRSVSSVNFINFISLSFILSFSDISLLTVFLCIFLYSSFDYYFFNDSENIDFLTLILFVQASGILLLSFTDFMNAFLALETISLASYILVGFLRGHKLSVQTGIKYLIISVFPTLFLILGFTILYKIFGSFHFDFFNIALIKSESTEIV